MCAMEHRELQRRDRRAADPRGHDRLCAGFDSSRGRRRPRRPAHRVRAARHGRGRGRRAGCRIRGRPACPRSPASCRATTAGGTRHGSPGHGADHVLPLLASPSLSVPVVGGRHGPRHGQSVALLGPPTRDNPRRADPAHVPRRLRPSTCWARRARGRPSARRRRTRGRRMRSPCHPARPCRRRAATPRAARPDAPRSEHEVRHEWPDRGPSKRRRFASASPGRPATTTSTGSPSQRSAALSMRPKALGWRSSALATARRIDAARRW